MKNHDMTTVLLTVAGCFLSSCQPARVTSVSQPLTLVNEAHLRASMVKFEFILPDWDGERVQWSAPSNFVIRANGDYFLFASSIKSTREGCGLFDCLESRTVGVNVRYFNNASGAACAGSILHTTDYTLTGIMSQQQKTDVASRGTDEQFKVFAKEIKCAVLTRWIGGSGSARTKDDSHTVRIRM
jgi:hypothetical protein